MQAQRGGSKKKDEELFTDKGGKKYRYVVPMKFSKPDESGIIVKVGRGPDPQLRHRRVRESHHEPIRAVGLQARLQPRRRPSCAEISIARRLRTRSLRPCVSRREPRSVPTTGTRDRLPLVMPPGVQYNRQRLGSVAEAFTHRASADRLSSHSTIGRGFLGNKDRGSDAGVDDPVALGAGGGDGLRAGVGEWNGGRNRCGEPRGAGLPGIPPLVLGPDSLLPPVRAQPRRALGLSRRAGCVAGRGFAPPGPGPGASSSFSTSTGMSAWCGRRAGGSGAPGGSSPRRSLSPSCRGREARPWDS